MNIINGVGTDSDLGSKLSVTVIATGFDVKEEEVEVVVGIGEDETLDSISKSKNNQVSNPKSLTEDFRNNLCLILIKIFRSTLQKKKLLKMK